MLWQGAVLVGLIRLVVRFLGGIRLTSLRKACVTDTDTGMMTKHDTTYTTTIYVTGFYNHFLMCDCIVNSTHTLLHFTKLPTRKACLNVFDWPAQCAVG